MESRAFHEELILYCKIRHIREMIFGQALTHTLKARFLKGTEHLKMQLSTERDLQDN